MTFEQCAFHGTFRSYQEEVLRDAERYLDDGRIHIVASPGSGKTVLGLELIRKLGKPALILAPTLTIRDQWGARFAHHFAPENIPAEAYVSHDLRSPALLTTITYQGLHAAFHHLIEEEKDEEAEAGETIDYSHLDLFTSIRNAGIGTICLDEAHHLRSEWQKALETVLGELKGTIKVIALTATPPYDAAPAEWNRYITTCGEIDAEIFVPELVHQKTLCPHQDYVYLGCPTEAEAGLIREHRRRAWEAVEEVLASTHFSTVVASIVDLYPERETDLLEHAEDHLAILALTSRAPSLIPIPRKLIRLLSPYRGLPDPTLPVAEKALQAILDGPERFGEEQVEALEHILKSRGLIERRRVVLVAGAKVRKAIVGSIGKLEAIRTIVAAEEAAMGDRMRLLVLTDFIQRDLLRILGTDTPLTSINTVTVYATITRTVAAPTAVLSGTLTIIPSSLVPDVEREVAVRNGRVAFKPLSDGVSCEVLFAGNNHIKVAVMTSLFGRGTIRVLIGTKALLGEGWDSPGINALILASFVGSAMLSNQMRGRAIRIDPADPDKTANIWHLATVEPDDELPVWESLTRKKDADWPVSEDFEALSRRMDSFVCPSYQNDGLRSGIDRLALIHPPFTRKGIDEINRAMLKKAADRDSMKASWVEGVPTSSSREILDIDEVPNKVLPQHAVYINVTLVAALTLIFRTTVESIIRLSVLGETPIQELLLLAALLVFSAVIGFLMYRILKHASPERSIRTLAQAVLRTFWDMGVIENRDVRLTVAADRFGTRVECGLRHATAHEKNRFASAMAELLSPIDKPRYLLVKKSIFGRMNPHYAFAVPTIIGALGANAAILARHLLPSTGKFELVFTRSEAGFRMLLQCRRKAFVNRNQAVRRYKKMSHDFKGKKRWTP